MNPLVWNEEGQEKQPRSRKSNGRSKSGCISCRQRRVKCDETRPRCSKCIKQSVACEYSRIDPSKEWQKSIVTFSKSPLPRSQVRPVHASLRGSSTACIASKKLSEEEPSSLESIPLTIYATPGINSKGFDIRDVQLLAHFTTDTTFDILGSQDIWAHDMVQLAVQNDFLMHTILMTAAVHLQKSKSSNQSSHAVQAAYHLQKSLKSFRKALNGSDASLSNNNAIIGTAFLHLIHGFSEPSFDADVSLDPDPLLPHSGGVYEIIRKTHADKTCCLFYPLCSPRLLPPAFPTSGPALDLLLMVKNHCEVRDADPEIYIAVIESLTPVFDAVTNRPNLANTPPDSLLLYLVTWLSCLPPNFVILIQARDPKALVIMAYYYSVIALVLDRVQSGWWWVRERPAYMITQIEAFLSEKFKIWMSWPLSVLENCRNRSMDGGNIAGLIETNNEVGQSHGEQLGILSDVQLDFRKIGV